MNAALLLLLAPLGLAQVAPSAPPRPFPQAAVPVEEALTSFSPEGLRLEWKEGRWQVWAGDRVLKDFGTRQNEARQGYTLLRDLRVNQLGTVGSPRVVMEYWLDNGRPPQAARMWGIRTVNFEPASLKVEQHQDGWYVGDGRQTLLAFGPHEDQARQALAVVNKHGFNQVALVGSPTPAMMVFLRQPRSGLSTSKRPLGAPPRPQKTQPIKSGKPGAPGTLDPSVLAALPPTPLIPSLAGSAVPSAPQSPIQRASYQTGAQPTAEPERPRAIVEIVPVDFQHGRVVRDGGDWKVAAEDYTVANLGLSEPDARRALAAMQFYRFTEHHRIGKGQPPLGFFLCNGQPPRGVMPGLYGEAFQAEMVMVRPMGDKFVLAQGQRVLIDCGPRAEDAHMLLQAIRRHGFDTLCRVGSGDQCLRFFVRSF